VFEDVLCRAEPLDLVPRGADGLGHDVPGPAAGPVVRECGGGVRQGHHPVLVEQLDEREPA
jgi:hypothetical protein